MLDFDASRLPRRASEWVTLLAAVRDAHTVEEQPWLEWKSKLNLQDVNDVGGHVARTVLGFANRDPDEAAQHVEGHGVLIVGMEPGNVVGVVPVDGLDLDRKVSAYVGGSDGPGWRADWHTFEGESVLVIVVDPPRWGDPIWAMRKEIGKYFNGYIFVRQSSGTDRADSEQVRALSNRLLRGKEQTLAIDVTVEYPTPIPKFTWDPRDLDSYVAATRKALLEPLDRREGEKRPLRPGQDGLVLPDVQRQIADMLKVTASWSTSIPEDRTAEQFRQEVDAWEGRVRGAWATAMVELARHFVPPPVIKVRNGSERNYTDLEVVLHADGDAFGREYRPQRHVRYDQYLPAEPRAYGPRKADWESRLRSTFAVPVVSSTVLGPRIEHDGSVTITVPRQPLHLRSHATEVLEDEVSILVPATRSGAVNLAWTATAINVDGVAKGQIELSFDAEPVDVFRLALESLD